MERDMKIYICNQYRGYASFKKIPLMLEKLRRILGKKIFGSIPLRIPRGSRYEADIPYSYEIFENDRSFILMEIQYESWINVPNAITLTIYNATEELVESIRDLMREYPVCSEKKSEWEYFIDYSCCPICGCSTEKDGIGFFIKEWENGQCPNCGWNFKSARTIPYVAKES